MFSAHKIKLSTRDPPFMSPLVKHLLDLRRKAIKKHDLELSNRLQEKINSLIRENQMRAVRQESNNHDPRNGGIQLIESRPEPNITFQSARKLIQVT